MGDRGAIDDVMDQMRSGRITASDAQRDLVRARLDGPDHLCAALPGGTERGVRPHADLVRGTRTV